MRKPSIFLVLLLCACGSAAQELRHRQHDELRAYTFSAPLESVWPVAAQMFATSGREVRSSGDHRLEGTWASGGEVEQRLALEGAALDGQRCRVFFTTDMKRTGQPLPEASISGVIHEELQLALIHHFNAEDARRLGWRRN
jgi:hypothetical protein